MTSTFFIVGLVVAVTGVLLDLISTERATNAGFEEAPGVYRKLDGSPNVKLAWIVNIGGLAALIAAYALGAGYAAGALLLGLGVWRGLVGMRNFRTVSKARSAK